MPVSRAFSPVSKHFLPLERLLDYKTASLKEQSKVSVGVLGLGRIGKIHALNLLNSIPGAILRSIYDVNPALSADLAKQHSGVQPFTDLSSLLNDNSLSAVVIASPTNTHADLIVQAARAGKHIFCEKPLHLELGRTHEVLQIVEEAKVKLQIGFQRRYDPLFAAAAQAARDKKAGKPLLLKITSRDPKPPPVEYIRASGGIFVDMTIHDFDMSRFILRSEPVSVFAAGANLLDPAIGEAGDIDSALTTVEFENGAFAVIDNCRQSAIGYDQRLELLSSLGVTTVTNPQVAPSPHPFFIARYESAYVTEMKAFIECVCSDGEPAVGGIDALQSLRMGLAATKSLQERRVVKMEEVK
jgi:myo-inositol 2-dehydrogenase / D-chiro-inositol 1-dehydrogenase